MLGGACPLRPPYNRRPCKTPRKTWQKMRKTRETANELVKHFYYIIHFIPETKIRNVVNDNDTRNKNTCCLVLEKVTALKRASCGRNGKLLPGLFNAFFGPAFWQCLTSQAQSAHRCNFMPCLLANPELALVCRLSQNQETLCGISNTNCDIFTFKVLYKFVDDSSEKYQQYSILILVSKLSLILIAIPKFISNADSDSEI